MTPEQVFHKFSDEYQLRLMASLTDGNARQSQPSTAPPFGDCRMCEAQWVREQQQRAEIAGLRTKNIACMEAVSEWIKQRAKWKHLAMLSFALNLMILVMAVSWRCF